MSNDNVMKWEDAIIKVLSASEEPLHYTDIADRISDEGLRGDKGLGVKPSYTVYSRIFESIKKHGEGSPFFKVSPGVFTMRSQMAKTESSAMIEQDDLISSFGMFWKREAVDWRKRKPQLLGMENMEADPVDFCEQQGVYLLYDGREVIYVGRSGRSLGERLREHTRKRLSTRWDRFSWFGLRPVSEEGKLSDLPEIYASANMIHALEALLIEALEPRQNMKRGDKKDDRTMEATEYIQKEDPELEKSKALEILSKS